MDSYERRAHFAHRFGTPLTTLNAGLELLERYLAEHTDDPRLSEIFELLRRSSVRIADAVALLNQRIIDAPEGLTLFVSDADLQANQTPVKLLPEPLPGPTQAPRPARRDPDARTCVLLIEDSSVYRALMTAHLNQHNFDVITAPDAIQGMDMARTHQPELIILDLMLPHLSGSDVSLIFAEDPETKHIPIVIYTALDPEERDNLDPRFHVIHKDQALEHLPGLIEQLIRDQPATTASTILVIEDDETMRQTLAIGLRDAGYEVTTVNSAEEGLRLTQFQAFDLIILDVLLPGIDGWQAITLLRERVQTATTPIMLLSALHTPREKVRGLQLGADDYITKPFDWSELLARVSASLRRREVEGSANPSTMLPGNKSIERALNTRIASGEPFAVAYCDMDNFKAYNDTYGFLKGDGMIHQAARIITKTVESIGAPGDFVGHIGGDDFVVITLPELVEALCQEILNEFDRLVPLFYDEIARHRGVIEQLDREGIPKVYPLASMSIGVISSLNHAITHFAQVSDLAADVKKRAKSFRGSAYFIESAQD